jgi:hypothetical protein
MLENLLGHLRRWGVVDHRTQNVQRIFAEAEEGKKVLE